MVSGPISPDDADLIKRESIPDDVFETFNTLIVHGFGGGFSVVYQDDVVQALCNLGYERTSIFSRKLLDIESAYELAGWMVEYEKPGYGESGRSHWTFYKQ